MGKLPTNKKLLISIILMMPGLQSVMASTNIEDGDAAYTSHNIKKAIQYYHIELRDSPGSIIARTRLAKSYRAKGYTKAFLKILDEVLTIAPTDEHALLMKSNYLISQGVLGEAETLLSTVLKNNPNNAEALNYLAQIHNSRGDTEAADELYLKMQTLGQTLGQSN